MPKLKGSTVKYINGNISIDKENDNVIYSDKDHIYLGKSDNSKYTSVTQLINHYVQPFNEDFWSSYKACESLLSPEEFYPLKGILLSTKTWKSTYLKTWNIDEKAFVLKKAEILQGYEDKKNKACERGTAIHEAQENMFYNNDTKITKYTGGRKFDTKKGYYKLDIDRAVYPEFLISYEFDYFLKIAGQVDLVIKDGNEITIIDWKSNEKITQESYYDRSTKKRQMMKFPLSNIQDCNFYHYTLQLSLYAYLLQMINSKFKIKKLAIVHFGHDGSETEYECQYLKEEVSRMLLDFRKSQKISTELNKDKTIIF